MQWVFLKRSSRVRWFEEYLSCNLGTTHFALTTKGSNTSVEKNQHFINSKPKRKTIKESLNSYVTETLGISGKWGCASLFGLSELSRLLSPVSASVHHCTDLQSGGVYWRLVKFMQRSRKDAKLFIISFFFLRLLPAFTNAVEEIFVNLLKAHIH